MKRNYINTRSQKQLLLLLALLCLYGGQALAQCGNDNKPFGFSEAPSVLGENLTLTDCLFGGEYRVITNLKAGATYRIASCGDMDFDSQLSIYDHDSEQALAYNDDYCGLQSLIDFVPPHDGDYRILLDDFFCESNTICMTISATLVELPTLELVNDDCIDALPLACNEPTIGSTQGATLDKTPYCGTGNGRQGGVWYQYEGQGQMVSLTTCMPGTSFDTKLRVYEGHCKKLICVAGNDDGSPRGQDLDQACFVSDFGAMINRASTVNWEAQTGTTYFILVHGFSTDAAEFELLLDCAAAPSI